MKEKKIVYYTDELHDDFSASDGKINRDAVDGSYDYFHRSIWFRIGAFFLYRVIATPLVWLYCKIWLGLRIENRAAVKKTKGCFIYLNHTQQVCDAYLPALCSFPKRGYVITGPETVSISGIRTIVAMLGAIPLPSALSAHRNYEDRLREVTTEKECPVIIYPEAHIWPYCNFIRGFPDTSFTYPVKMDRPVIAGAVVYRQRRFFKNHHPHATLYLSDPMYPDQSLPLKKARKKLWEDAYAFMSEKAKDSYEFIAYKKKPEE